ncbi:NADH:flavin oxidoreductase/NADH oxidase [Calocera cornea HHB12733]|uniref:NADH:flavin oxidoreductase/NADH oxidase n=1 Tax=Calocera cornea HHB12733 TaxID=1353952 RepID=A0A165J8P6_9BASI|nr:NADH:flavin oxidoreductase/NADH oxidase [Calocera cornea HHB12733]
MAANGIHEELFVNPRAEGADQYYPLNEPVPIGHAFPASLYPQNDPLPLLFQPLSIRGVEFKNRIWVAPMCMYSSDNGHATDFHLVHIGSMALRGAGAIILEATAVLPAGRIAPEDAGLWTDSQIAPLRRIVEFCHAHGTKVGIQLAHAGRKASTYAPWIQDKRDARVGGGRSVAGVVENGWPDEVVGPSEIPHDTGYAYPNPLNQKGIDQVVEAFAAATERCKQVGFDFIEIHGAHGYLLHSFCSPLSNDRDDDYGGSLENRLRFPLAIARRVRAVWGDKPLFYRVSATDWAEGPEKEEKTGEWLQWGIDQSTVLARRLHEEAGMDLIDVSTGGLWKNARIAVFPGYQVPFAAHIKKAVPGLLTGAVGHINSGKQAESYLKEGSADVVLVARELLRNVDLPLEAAQELGVAVKPASQYEMGWVGMMGRRHPW